MNIVAMVLGTIILIMGRRLFWLLVGLLGFMAGFVFTEAHLADSSQFVMLLVALAVGILGAVLAMFMERLAFALAGGFAGAYVAAAVAASLGLSGAPGLWMLIGGVLGAIVAAVVMDWAIIVLSSLAGAGMVVQGLALGSPTGSVVYVVLAVAGILIQASTMPSGPAVTEDPSLRDRE